MLHFSKAVLLFSFETYLETLITSFSYLQWSVLLELGCLTAPIILIPAQRMINQLQKRIYNLWMVQVPGTTQSAIVRSAN